MNKKKWFIVILLAFMHLLCDFICAFKVVGTYSYLHLEYGLLIFVIYNSLAFLGQPFIGMLIDKIYQPKLMLLLSCLCLGLGVVINYWVISLIFLGIGNQIFHVIGGKICTNMNSKRASHLGVFVSLGAIGLALGTNFNSISWILYTIYLVYLILAVIVVYNLYKPETVLISRNIKTNKIIIGLSLMTLVVFIRSYLGKIIHYDFEITLLLLILLPSFGALGKFIGGFIRDKVGSNITVTISMLLCIAILIFGDSSIILMSIGMILINISMPISLFELNQLFKGHEAFNFGILAAVLFPGVALGIITPYNQISYIIIIILACLLTILSIFIVNKWRKQNE